MQHIAEAKNLMASFQQVKAYNEQAKPVSQTSLGATDCAGAACQVGSDTL